MTWMMAQFSNAFVSDHIELHYVMAHQGLNFLTG